MSKNYEVIVIFPIYGQFGAIRIPNAQSVKLAFSLIVTFYLTEAESRSKNSVT